MTHCARCGSNFSGPGILCGACVSRTTRVEGRSSPPGGVQKQPIPDVSDPSPPTLTAERARFSATGESATRRTPISNAIPESTLQLNYGAAADAKDPLIGQQPLGQYEILRKIGEGAFGAVYLAEQPSIRRKAVIKVLHKKLVESEVVVKRFEREAAVLAKLDNQHLVRLYNFGELEDGQPFLAMEYGGDTTLADAIKVKGRFEPDRALLIASQVCDALEEAHQHGIIHRDLKPRNVLLGRRGSQDWAKVVDVGIAKILRSTDISDSETLTGGGTVIGTPAYFSPEQARGLSLDARSDLYSLGVLLYEMLTGRLPVVGVAPLDFVRAHTSDAPIPMKNQGVHAPRWLEQLVMKALEKDPGRRFQSAHEMGQALRAGRQLLVRPHPNLGTRAAVLCGVVAAGLAIVGAVAMIRALVQRTQAVVPPSPAAQPAANPSFLRLVDTPPGARIIIDGVASDTNTPEVASGKHHLRVEAQGFVPLGRDLMVGEAQTVVVAATLEKEPVVSAKTAVSPDPRPQKDRKRRTSDEVVRREPAEPSPTSSRRAPDEVARREPTEPAPTIGRRASDEVARREPTESAPTIAESEIVFNDPVGDDDGPGGYTYPTDPAYKRGSFDLTQFRVRADKDKVSFDVTLDSDLEDVWKMGTGFSVQMIFVFIKTGPKGSPWGFTATPPGLNVEFAPEERWNRLIILSPQPPARVRAEVRTKAVAMKDAILVPDKTVGHGRVISASVPRSSLGSGDPSEWGYQVVVQSNEGFPGPANLLARVVNAVASAHRFGGGVDGDCDPHLIDVLAGGGRGEVSEVEEQHTILKYECNRDGSPKTIARLRMIYHH